MASLQDAGIPLSPDDRDREFSRALRDRPAAKVAGGTGRASPSTDDKPEAKAVEAADDTSLAHIHLPPHIVRHRIIVPIDDLHQGTLTALRYAQSLSQDVTAVHVSMDSAETGTLQRRWPTWADGVRLVILDSPHNMVLEPLLEYIQRMMELHRPNEIIP